MIGTEKRKKKEPTQCFEVWWLFNCLVPRSHYSTRLMRFASRGPSKDMSPKWIDQEGQGRHYTGTRQVIEEASLICH